MFAALSLKKNALDNENTLGAIYMNSPIRNLFFIKFHTLKAMPLT